MQKTEKDLTDIELKAIAFDEIQKINQAEKILTIINQELASRAQKTQPKTNMEEDKIETPTTESEVVAEETVEIATEDTTETPTVEEVA